MLVLSREQHEDIVLTPMPAVDLRAWLHRLPIDQAQRRAGLLLIEELEAIETRVSVVELRGDKVRLGFNAPRDRVTIHRLEVQQAIDALLQPAGEPEVAAL